MVCGLVGLPLESFAADGTPDTTFSANIGNGFNNNVTLVAVQSDGKIVVGGYFTTINVTASSYIARLNADGTPDTTFSTNIGSGFSNNVYGVAVQSDGKIVVGGEFTSINVTASNRIARLNRPPAPAVTSISPTSGSTAGGTPVTITGTDLTGATGITVGGAACTAVNVASATSATCTTPAGTAGTASVVVTTGGGSNAANTLFTYTTPSPTPSAVPTLSQWAQLMLGLMVMATLGWYWNRERSY